MKHLVRKMSEISLEADYFKLGSSSSDSEQYYKRQVAKSSHLNLRTPFLRFTNRGKECVKSEARLIIHCFPYKSPFNLARFVSKSVQIRQKHEQSDPKSWPREGLNHGATER